jgi:hypothetical protein
MHAKPKLALAGLAAAMLLLAAVGSSSANRLSVNEEAFKIVWALPLSGGEIENGELGGRREEPTVECAVVVHGSFHSTTFAKVEGALVGSVTEATVGECEGGGGMTVLRETLPWHLRYDSFSGTLPLIGGIMFDDIGVSFEIAESFGQPCLFSTSAEYPSRLIAELEEGGAVTVLRADESALIPLTGGLICEGQFANFIGDASMTTEAEGEFVFTLI